MRLVRFVGFLFYRYYSEGRWPDSAPLTRTIGSMSLLVFFHELQILLLIGNIDLPDRGWEKNITIIIMIGIPALLISLILKKKDMERLKEKYQKDWDRVFDANVWLIVYCILSAAAIIGLAIWRRHQ